MEQRDGFLSRWSRLKRNADAAPAGKAEVKASPTPAEEQLLPEGKTLEDLIAELSKVEDLVPGQSLAAFMQPWVPTALRNAALHRMWLLDPAISGYVDPALDYAYDYNTLGATPGFGPIEASQEMKDEVAEMFDRALRRAGPVEDSRPESDPAAGQTGNLAGRDAGRIDVPADAPPAAPAPAPEVDAAAHNKSNDPNEMRRAARRHGGALPG